MPPIPIRRLRVGPIGAWVALAVALRLLWVLAVPSRPVGDFALYRESAAYLVEHGALDPEFIYMPGYVFLLAAVTWLGGGLLAAKMVGVAAGGVVVFAAAGIAESLFGRRAGVIAAALGALWPAGIAVTSVTGTDLPAGALVTLAVWVMVRHAAARPWVAAVVSGVVFGLGAWIRAVTVPLAALSFFFWWAVEPRWTGALRRTAVTVAVAVAVLLPWGLRNRAVYGDFFLTDSHGGHTALVGANPNSEGTYSRSLNLMFTRATGYRLMDVPARHRASDRAAYDLAKAWSAFEPAYAFGLLAAKADRLLSHERNLLYWPVFRQGVLSDADRRFEDAHRTALERLADGFWYAIVALFVAGVVLFGGARSRAPAIDRRPVALLAFPAAMIAIYASFFAEVRYHLAIVPLLFPFAAAALAWAAEAPSRRFASERGTVLRVGLAIGATFGAWLVLLRGGEALRAGHRWAVSLCAYPSAGETHLCSWRRAAPAAGPSPVRGVWDGIGLRMAPRSGDAPRAAARTELSLDRGLYRLRVRGLFVGPGGASVAASVAAGGSVLARALVPVSGGARVPEDGAGPANPRADHTLVGTAPDPGAEGIPMEGTIDHQGGPLSLEIAADFAGSGPRFEQGLVWFSELVVERFPAL